MFDFPCTVCAAPGSKTFQLLEMVHKEAEVGALPNGMVIFFLGWLTCISYKSFFGIYSLCNL